MCWWGQQLQFPTSYGYALTNTLHTQCKQKNLLKNMPLSKLITVNATKHSNLDTNTSMKL